MALMAVDKEKLMGSNCLGLSILIEVLKPCNSISIGCPASLTNTNHLITWHSNAVVPHADIGLPCKYDLGGDHLPKHPNTLDHYCPNSTAWLDQLWPTTPMSAYNHKL